MIKESKKKCQLQMSHSLLFKDGTYEIKNIILLKINDLDVFTHEIV